MMAAFSDSISFQQLKYVLNPEAFVAYYLSFLSSNLIDLVWYDLPFLL